MKKSFLFFAVLLLTGTQAFGRYKQVHFDFLGVPSSIDCLDRYGSVDLKKYSNGNFKWMDSFEAAANCKISGYAVSKSGPELSIQIYRPFNVEWSRNGYIQRVATPGTASNNIFFRLQSPMAEIEHDDYFSIPFPGGAVTFWPDGVVKMISASQAGCFRGKLLPSGREAVFRKLYFSKVGRLTHYDLSNGWCVGN